MKSWFHVGWLLLALSWGGIAVAEDAKADAAKPEVANAARPVEQQDPTILYYTEDKAKVFGLENGLPMNLDRWKGLRPGGRQSFLLKLYYASTRAKSDSGLVHAVCFEGLGTQVSKDFFTGKGIPEIKDTTHLQTTVCEDESAIGVDFVVKEKDKSVNRHFRLYSCGAAGKNPIVAQVERQLKRGALPGLKVQTVAFQKVVDDDDETLASVADSHEDEGGGYGISDTVTPKEQGKLSLFKLKSDYENAKVEKSNPWDGMSVKTKKDAEKLVVTLQKYFYDDLATQSSDPEKIFDAHALAAKGGRYWCNMPWLNVGANGREAIHGLTNERPLNKSHIFDFDPDKVKGSDWGVAYYNSTACTTLGEVFGPTGKRKASPDWKKKFVDGAMAVKILFTTAVFSAFENAFAWQAHVSEPFSTHRTMHKVRHIQMDIWLKDSRLDGIDKDMADGGMMTTYYFNEGYDGKFKGIPAALNKMRPMGLQVGFEAENTTLFDGAETNQDHGLLNGPADNPKSSCLSCHGTAGTKLAMAPGVTTNAKWREVRGEALDQSQQLALARRNFQTQSQQQKN